MHKENQQSEENGESYVLVPKRWLESISRDQKQILSLLENGDSSAVHSVGDYLSEQEAKKLLNKKTTWFWKMRTSGQIASTKIGGTNYYEKKDILNILDKNKKNIPGLPFQKKIA